MRLVFPFLIATCIIKQAVGQSLLSTGRCSIQDDNFLEKSFGMHSFLRQSLRGDEIEHQNEVEKLRIQCTSEIQKINEKLNKMEANAKVLTNERRKSINDILMNDRNRTVAFTVSTSTDLKNYNHKTIIYDKVITNIGGGYNNTTGIFTCPKAGTFVFTWSTMSNQYSAECYAYIYHNGYQLLQSYSSETDGGWREVASNTIVLALTVGDRIWIATTTGFYCHGYPLTGFSGWRL